MSDRPRSRARGARTSGPSARAAAPTSGRRRERRLGDRRHVVHVDHRVADRAARCTSCMPGIEKRPARDRRSPPGRSEAARPVPGRRRGITPAGARPGSQPGRATRIATTTGFLHASKVSVEVGGRRSPDRVFDLRFKRLSQSPGETPDPEEGPDGRRGARWQRDAPRRSAVGGDPRDRFAEHQRVDVVRALVRSSPTRGCTCGASPGTRR